MHRVQYWLLLNIAKRPKFFTYGAGILIAVALLTVGVITILWVDKNSVAIQQDRTAQLARAITAEADGMLAHLTVRNRLGCSAQDLIYLNALLLQSRFLREIGILDDERRLVCSTALGRLPQPVKGNYPVVTSRQGREMLVNVPLQMANKSLTATIVQSGHFNVVISPYATQALYAGADAVWLHTRDGLALLKSSAPADVAAGLRDQAGAVKETDMVVDGLGYALMTAVPESDLVLQTQRDLGTITRQNSVLVLAMLTGSLLIAILTVGTIAPHVVELCGVQNRIRYLCDEAHLLLLYQPIFDLATLKPVGCEVLMRMREGNAILMPEQIIPAILNSGLARQVDHAVARKAIHELAARLPAQEGTFKLALNFFPDSIDQATLLPVLKNAIQAAGRGDFQICLEVTEHSFSNELIGEVEAMKAAGFLIAVDDFGTGYSNLQLVTKLSPDILKIDKSFVFELEEATLRSNLIPEIMNIARAVGAEAVAEGIESAEQAQLLAAQGVQYGQGYALARPMALEPFMAFLHESRHGTIRC